MQVLHLGAFADKVFDGRDRASNTSIIGNSEGLLIKRNIEITSH